MLPKQMARFAHLISAHTLPLPVFGPRKLSQKHLPLARLRVHTHVFNYNRAAAEEEHNASAV